MTKTELINSRICKMVHSTLTIKSRCRAKENYNLDLTIKTVQTKLTVKNKLNSASTNKTSNVQHGLWDWD